MLEMCIGFSSFVCCLPFHARAIMFVGGVAVALGATMASAYVFVFWSGDSDAVAKSILLAAFGMAAWLVTIGMTIYAVGACA